MFHFIQQRFNCRGPCSRWTTRGGRRPRSPRRGTSRKCDSCQCLVETQTWEGDPRPQWAYIVTSVPIGGLHMYFMHQLSPWSTLLTAHSSPLLCTNSSFQIYRLWYVKLHMEKQINISVIIVNWLTYSDFSRCRHLFIFSRITNSQGERKDMNGGIICPNFIPLCW